MQLTDSLVVGGAERVTVNLCNLLPRDRFDVHVGVTRMTGPLEAELEPDVKKLFLRRRRRWDDVGAVRVLVRYVREHGIRLLHCHKSTNFLASLASFFLPDTRILWHDHYGQFDVQPRWAWVYRLGAARVDGIISVSEPLARWARDALRFPAERVFYVPNFVHVQPPKTPAEDLPEGSPRIACVANLRPQKDVANLVRAMVRVREVHAEAVALLIGAPSIPSYAEEVAAEIERLGVSKNVQMLGPRSDIPAVLAACDLAVLPSASEGLPLTLIEYGMLARPSVSTRVGQCEDVADGGRVVRLVAPGDCDALADAMLELLASPDERARLGRAFREFVEAHYGPSAGMPAVVSVYDTLLGEDER